MHGVGLVYAQRAFEAFGLSAFTAVDQQVWRRRATAKNLPLIHHSLQMRPDPDFPTVKYPNPEEGKGALQLAMNTAETVGARVILANDPDADRLAVAEQQDG